LAVVLIATTAYGQGATMTLTVGGASSYEPTPGETFRVDISIASDVAMSAWGGNPWDTAGAGYAIDATVIGGYYKNLALNYTNGAVPPPVSPQGWDINTSVAEKWDAGIVNDMNTAGTLKMGTAAASFATGATSGFAAYIMLTAPAAEVAGVVTTIDLTDAYVGDLEFNNLPLEVVPLTLTPEPVSGLLLLAGLPLLRRRR
jgi:hypothetical protein